MFGFVHDSPREEAGFEPSVPRDTIKTSRGLVSSLLDSLPNVGAGKRELEPRSAGLPLRDRWFESSSLRRGVLCELTFGDLEEVLAALVGRG